MSSEILSQNDIDLLLSGGQEAAAASAARSAKAREAQVYDFRRPHRVSKDRHRTLQAMYERFAKTIEGWLMGRVRDQIELNLQSVEQISFGDFALSLPTPCCSFLLEVDNSGGEQGVIDFGHEFGCFLVDRMLGGRGTPAVLDRALTPIERMVIRTAAERISTALREIWADYVQLDMALTGFESIPEILRATGGDSPALVATVEANAGGSKSLMSLCLPFTVLDSFFADSGKPRRSTAGTPEERAAARRTNEASLRASNIPVAARMPDFRLNMRALADLKAGSVLATGLPLDSPVHVLVNGQPCFTAQAARVGRRLAVSVADSLGPVAAALAATGAASAPLWIHKHHTRGMDNMTEQEMEQQMEQPMLEDEQATPAEFAEVPSPRHAAEAIAGVVAGGEMPLSALYELMLPVTIELGRTRMSVQEVLQLARGSVIELDRLAGEPVDIFVGDRRFAEGEVVVLGENFGVRITRIFPPAGASAEIA